ncbi:TolC family protein [Geopseudomonas aromaticivorans]
MTRLTLLLLAAWLPVLPLQAEPLSLVRLLEQAAPAPTLRQGAAELEAMQAATAQRRAEAGWQLFGSGSAGSYRELGEEGGRDDYSGRQLALGVRHPLLGTLQRRLAQVQSGLQAEEAQRLRLAVLRAEQRLQLRSAYADWWRVEEEIAVCRRIRAAAGEALPVLRARSEAGWMLPSEAALLGERWSRLERLCREADEGRGLAQAWLGELAGQPLPAGATPAAEPLAARPQAWPQWQQVLERHPRLGERHSQLAVAGQQRELPWYAALESTVSLGRGFERRSRLAEEGGDWVASLDVSAPFDVLDYGRAQRREGEARYQAAQASVEAERHSLRQALLTALREHREALEGLHWQRERLESRRLRQVERQQRSALDGEAGVEQRQVATLDYYEALLQQVAAWHGLWLSESALHLFIDDDPAAAPLLGEGRERWQGEPGALPAPAGWSQGVYIWDSRVLLDARRRDGELEALQRAGMQRLYIGLSAEQVAGLPALRQPLQQLLQASRARGLQPVLLLGDPAWLRPAGRAGLQRLLQALAGLPFAALHLDLEVEQLGWPVPAQRLRDWLDTLALAARESEWPLELSSHHRWFAEESGEVCVPCALPQLGVGQVSLMIYTANAARSAELAASIARRWPALRFRLAQSVEPQLPAAETLAGRSAGELQRQVGRWQAQLQPEALAGIDWQAWSHYPR